MITDPGIRQNLVAIRADVKALWEWYEGDHIPYSPMQEMRLANFLSELAQITAHIREQVCGGAEE